MPHRTRLHAIMLLLLAFCLAWPPLTAPAADEGETRTGFFEYAATLYDRSTGQNQGLIKIPHNTPLTLRQIDQEGHRGYGVVTYQGVTGFVRIFELQPLPKDGPDDRAGKQLYAPDVRMLRDHPLHGADIQKRLPPETLVTVLARSKGMLKVEALGLTGYIYSGDLQELGPDSPLESGLRYSTREQALLMHPLAGGEALKNLRQGELVTLLAQNRGYFRVKAGDAEGYVKKEGLAQIGQLAEDVMLIFAESEVPTYREPGLSLGGAGSLKAGRLYRVTAQAGDFLQLQDSGQFVEAARVEALVLTAFKSPRLGFVEAPQPLLSRPEGQGEDAAVLTPYQLYSFTGQAGSWWYMDDGQLQGFVKAQALNALPQKGDAMNRTYALYTGSQALPGAVSRGAKGQVLRLDRQYGNQRFTTDQGAFVHRSQVAFIGSDAPLTPHTVTATPGLALLSLPDSKLAAVLTEIPEGEALHVTGFCRSYLLVNYGGLEGYVPGQTLKTHETRYLSDTEDLQPLVILVNKADLSVSIYPADPEGQRKGAPLRTETAALGKRTTPTPSGRFVLGQKQRWVRFAYTSAPHGIAYLKGRYLHGIPCHDTTEDAVAAWARDEIGSFATGGCVRMPFDMAAWIYFNCPSYTTWMEVINGQ